MGEVQARPGATALGKRIYGQLSNDWGPIEGASRSREGMPALDDFDTQEWALAYGMAWALSLVEDPFLSDGDRSELVGEAAWKAFQASATCGGWEAMEAGEPPEDRFPGLVGCA